ncbi:hypothetical protein EB796_021325 [Bugula neritina]|uniref:Uncharacterized protein n=1 Tax=Bugula neritina TaxID=10212 RepID=A0A7J7J2N8_BUGNE|nr:hypothetical protein EB796_021325 [Bugula neritina]
MLCTYECLTNERCHGVQFHIQTEIKCSFETCLNPDLLTEYRQTGVAVYVKDDLGKSLNMLLARDKLATQSSYYDRALYKASHGNDGIYYNASNPRASLVHTEIEYRPWWRVDLQEDHCVWAVNILNRIEVILSNPQLQFMLCCMFS